MKFFTEKRLYLLLTGPTVIVGLGTILSKLSGFVRLRILSTTLGVGWELDAYYAAFRIPDLLSGFLIAGTLSVALIPVFAKYLETDQAFAFAFAGKILKQVVWLMIGVAVLVGIFALPLTRLSMPGFSDTQVEVTADLTRIVMLGQVFLAMSVMITSVLQTLKSFFWASLSPLFYNLGIVLSVFVFYPRLGVMGVALGVLLGAIVHLLVQLPDVRRRWIFSNTAGIDTSQAEKDLWRLYLPRIFYLDIGQAGLFLASFFGSFFVSGTIAVYILAYDLALAPLGVIAGSISTVGYPELSRLYAQNLFDDFFALLVKNVKRMIIWILPLAGVLLVFRFSLVEFLLFGGAFTETSAYQVGQALLPFAFGLVPLAFLPFLTRVFWARFSGKLPLVWTWVCIVFMIVLSTRASDATGLAMAVSACAWILSLGLFLKIMYDLSRTVSAPVFRAGKILIAKVFVKELFVSVCACGFSALALQLLPSGRPFSLGWFIANLGAGLVGFLIFCSLKKVLGKT